VTHDTKNVESLLTGGAEMINVAAEGQSLVENNAKKLCFLSHFDWDTSNV
jgi:hypothetical protein